jgi:septal ring factor EnvC (AmiA/AmiB activator)
MTRSAPPDGVKPPPPGMDLAASVADMRASLTQRLSAAEREATAHSERVAELARGLAEAQTVVARLEGLLAESDAQLRANSDRVRDLEQLVREKEARLEEEGGARRAIAGELSALQQRAVELQVGLTVNAQHLIGTSRTSLAPCSILSHAMKEACGLQEHAPFRVSWLGLVHAGHKLHACVDNLSWLA